MSALELIECLERLECTEGSMAAARLRILYEACQESGEDPMDPQSLDVWWLLKVLDGETV